MPDDGRKQRVMVTSPSRSMRWTWGAAAAGGLVVLALLVLWSRYTELGITLGGGGRYWVERAAEADDEDEAREHLRRVLATPYGVNLAENAVRDLEDRERRIRLWRLLIELAPNDGWRATYSLALEREATSSSTTSMPRSASPARSGR
jgi:hypothetical protein